MVHFFTITWFVLVLLGRDNEFPFLKFPLWKLKPTEAQYHRPSKWWSSSGKQLSGHTAKLPAELLVASRPMALVLACFFPLGRVPPGSAPFRRKKDQWQELRGKYMGTSFTGCRMPISRGLQTQVLARLVMV